MKKYFKHTFIAIGILVVAFACKDSYLDTPPQAALAGSTLASSKNGVNSTLIASYKSLLGWTGNDAEGPWGTGPSNWEFNIAADETHKGSEPGDGDTWLTFELFQWSPDNQTFRARWVADYEGIVRANSAINTAKAFLAANPTEKAYADATIGEATFLRAFFHFEAYKIWKNVPYYLETDIDFQKANDQPVLPLVIKDLETAIALLPANKTAVGRVDKTIATAYLGKAKLYAGDYTGALAAFNTVISSGKYALADSFYDNFSISGDNNKESIFAAQASVNDGDPNGANGNYGERLAYPHGDSPYGCCGFKQPTYDLAYAFKVDEKGLPIPVVASTTLKRIESGASDLLDPRIDYTMGRTNVPYLNWGVQKDSWIRGQGYMGWYSPKKNASANGDQTLSGGWAGTQLSNLNVELMRYADVLLMAAECEVEVGSLANAQKYVNMIRKRAGSSAQGSSSIKVAINSPEITWAKYNVGTYDVAWTDKTAARNAVRLERKLELALEGHRVFDLQRWGTFIETATAYNARERKVVPVLANANAPTATNLAFPLPTSEVARSGGKIKQNAGY
ncbi:RagB/SusD family nutrient uptake outer membrane protein [Arcicella sp. LKC2W]|uniref:RagB/SusD family nutrient uptake outer membrane protein n=1 Tax=Arcicella sp. LKC2W TaxID=2984198 RepID=UPI002B202C58|nr:RagB/SusD family nutrient uptake outer membrane protein [Arcicella sp. LKC2W]MEA5460128.1 RagB/SusD family nutrient uptake outer membrane protein [Arcicella sp. LKC2W]